MTATATLPVIAESTTCEHAWALDSRHTTSLGLVRYETCVRCTAHRVDLLPSGAIVPQPLTRTIGR